MEIARSGTRESRNFTWLLPTRTLPLYSGNEVVFGVGGGKMPTNRAPLSPFQEEALQNSLPVLPIQYPEQSTQYWRTPIAYTKPTAKAAGLQTNMRGNEMLLLQRPVSSQGAHFAQL
ncbi:hypothetical protein DdX_08024 [Ditylenchus destructor]|uniref:Uncharacterized protein n=1 Tax=Ditylenchus destructor TaxID=166010 RepID=A0AAD4N566_9BILA|nr:hypothetical protein DdX_08024 [Ditylenchus destructor]